MKITKEKVENSQAYLTVEMEPAEVEESMEASYRRLAKKANIPGFRKGKAPRSILENYLGKESVLEEALKHLVPQAYEEAIKEHDIKPLAQPDIEVTQTDPVIFKAVVPLMPTVEIGDYHSISLTPDTVEITEEKINAVLEELRHQHATWEPVERPLDYGDMAVIDINSEVEEKPFIKKLGAQYQVVKESASPVPGFAEQLIGMKKDDEKAFKLSLPDDYIQSELAGKEVSFKVKVSEIKQENLPGLDDELAKQVSADYNTLDLLREEVTRNLQQRGEERARTDFEERVVNAVVEISKIEFPPILIDMEINRVLSEQEKQLQMRGMGMDLYLKSINKTEEELRNELRPAATKNVAGSLMLEKVSESENIQVEEDEINTEIEKIIQGVASDRQEELRKLIDSPQSRASIKRSLTTRKTVDLLTEIARNSEANKTEVKEEQ